MFRILLAAGLLLLDAPAMAKSEPTPAQLAVDHGLVTARFHPSLPDTQLGVPMLSPPTIGLRPSGGRDDGRDDIYLELREDDADSFGRWLPAGRYRLASWRQSRWEEGPEIEVVAGRITDLGEVLEVSLGGDDVVLLPLAHPEVDARLDVWRKEAGAHLASPEPLRWQPAEVPAPVKMTLQGTGQLYGGGLLMDLMMRKQRDANRTEARAQLRELRSPAEFQARVLDAMPPTRDDAAVGEDGRLYFGADFGRIRVREADGRWHTLDTGALADITAVEWHAGRLLAGTERGVLLASTDDGATWSTLRRFDANEAIGDVDHAGGRWFVTTTHRAYNPKSRMYSSVRTTLYVAAEDDLSDLSESARFAQKINSGFVTWKFGRGEAHGDHYYIEAYPELHRLHLPSGEWTTQKVPGSVAGLAVSPGSGAVTVLATGLYLSTNHGDRFVRLYAPGGKGLVANGRFHDSGSGWLATWRNTSLSTSVLVVHELAKGQGWTTHGEAPLGCRLLLRDAAGDPSFCASVDGSLFRREPTGWHEEFSID